MGKILVIALRLYSRRVAHVARESSWRPRAHACPGGRAAGSCAASSFRQPGNEPTFSTERRSEHECEAAKAKTRRQRQGARQEPVRSPPSSDQFRNRAAGHGTTRWQIYDWRKQIRKGNLVVPESVAGLPIFAELVVDDGFAETPAARGASEVEIVVGDIVIRAGAGADEGQLTRALRAARAAAS